MTVERPAKGGGRPARSHTAPGADDAALGLVVTTARIALAASRWLARAPGLTPFLERSAETGRAARLRGRERIESAAQTALSAPEIGRLVDEALAGPLPETITRSSIEHRVGGRLAAQLEPEAARLIEQVLDSKEFERALERALSSPKVRDALARQTTSLVEEIVVDLSRRAVGVDAKLAFGRARGGTAPYAGLASRSLAFATDLVIAHFLFLVAATTVALVASLVGDLRPAWLFGTLAAAGWILLVGSYFVLFWTLGGRSPGMRMLRLRVVDQRGDPPTLGRAIARFGALLVAITPMLAGLIPVLFDERRRGLHDLLAGTVVVYAD
jgi:uncharacterized RDD family membrane protein YckC